MREASPRRVEGKYIYFWHNASDDKPRTEVWKVFSKGDNDWLGQIGWFPQWRKYSFRSTYHAKGEHGIFLSDVWFEEVCMREISNFCVELTRKHKENVK